MSFHGHEKANFWHTVYHEITIILTSKGVIMAMKGTKSKKYFMVKLMPISWSMTLKFQLLYHEKFITLTLIFFKNAMENSWIINNIWFHIVIYQHLGK